MLFEAIKTAVITDDISGLFSDFNVSFSVFSHISSATVNPENFDLIIIDLRNGRKLPANLYPMTAKAQVMFAADGYSHEEKVSLSDDLPVIFATVPITPPEIEAACKISRDRTLHEVNEKRLKSLAILGQMYEADFDDIIEYALDSAVEQSSSSEGSVSIMDRTTDTLSLMAEHADKITRLYPLSEKKAPPERYNAMISEVVSTGYSVIDNISWPRQMVIPIMSGGGISLILTLSGKNEPYEEIDEIGLINYMESVWRLKERKDQEEEISQLNAELEMKVQERTAQLKTSESRFRTAFESISNGMAIISLEGIVYQGNHAFANMIGFDEKEVEGRSIFDFIHKDHEKITRKQLMAMKDGSKTSYLAIRKYRHKDGRNVTLSVSAALAKDAEGMPLYVITQFVDITESERTRIERDKIFEHSRDIISVVNFHGEIRYINKAAEKILGIKTDEIMNKTMPFLFEKGDAMKAKSFVAKLISGSNIIDYETRHHTPSGLVWISWFASADNDNRLIYAIGRDITERKKAEDSLKTAIIEAERANLAKSEFIANISHEIRTPLNAVIGFSELICSRMEDPKLLSFASAIKSSGKTLLNLINDILDISKLDAMDMKPELVPTTPEALLKEIVNVFTAKAVTKGIDISAELDEDVPHCLLLDVSRLRQILLNLAGNAVKFTKEGFVKIKASCENSADDKLTLIIQVTDSGIGIPESDFKMIFEPFRQRTGIQQYGGTGLGLAISKKLAEIMGGKITLSSVPGRGSVFSVILPFTEICEIQSRSDDGQQNVFFLPATVLVADDDETSRTLIKETLTGRGLSVLEAQNGSSAALIAKEAKPDLIFMDIRMPEMNGYEAAAIIRNTAETANIPMIGNTAAKEETNSSGIFSDFIYKPIDSATLLSLCSKYLKTSEEHTTTAVVPAHPDADLVRAVMQSEKGSLLSEEIKKAGHSAVDLSAIQSVCKLIGAVGTKDASELSNRLQTYIDNMDIDKLKFIIDAMNRAN